MRTKRIAVIAGLVLAAVIGIACSSGGKAPTAVDPGATGPAATANVSMFTYGQTVKIGEKFEVTVTPIAGYTPNSYAAGYTGGAATAFEVTIKNDSQAPLSMFTPSFSANTAEGPADSIFDSSNGISMATGELFPGESTKFKIAFNGAVVRVKVEGFLDMSQPAYFQAAA